MNEAWKEVPGYDGAYLVSNLGRVKSLKGRSCRILQTVPSAGGYLRVNLCMGGCRKTAYVHKLVAEAFIPNLEGLPEVNHKDENKENNRVENLEWCSTKYNRCYGTRGERIGKHFRKRVRCIETGVVYDSISQAGLKTDSNETCIGYACRGKIKTANGYHWEYVGGNHG